MNFITEPSTSRYLIAALFCVMGLLHFIKPNVFVSIMPDYIPYHEAMVFISGIGELIGGIGILISETRIFAVYVLLILLIAVFPANIDMAVKAYRGYGLTAYTWMLILRLPLQFVLMYWVYWAGTNV